MWGKVAMFLLIGGTAASCMLLAMAGVNRLRLVPRQSRKTDRATSVVIGVVVISGALYIVGLLIRYLMRRPDWLFN